LHVETHTVEQMLDRMQQQLAPFCESDPSVVMIGIKTGGVSVAAALHEALGIQTPLGELNISFYRDDFSSVGLHPVIGPSTLKAPIDGKHILLVDDVLSTGRTVRAAMNEIFDFGRPSRITLAVLVQRDGHELPIRADVVGENMNLSDFAHVQLNTNPWSLDIGDRS
jgi:pyrimidine operon attenuation protein / uracil phosphoribosyltransferase